MFYSGGFFVGAYMIPVIHPNGFIQHQVPQERRASIGGYHFHNPQNNYWASPLYHQPQDRRSSFRGYHVHNAQNNYWELSQHQPPRNRRASFGGHVHNPPQNNRRISPSHQLHLQHYNTMPHMAHPFYCSPESSSPMMARRNSANEVSMSNKSIRITYGHPDSYNTSPYSSTASSSPVDSPVGSRRASKNILNISPETMMPINLKSVNTANMAELDLTERLSKYIINPTGLKRYGFPVAAGSGLVEIVKPSFPKVSSKQQTNQKLDSIGPGSIERECHRCKRLFLVTKDGQYLSTENCTYHWGKLVKKYASDSIYTCCQGSADSIGCTQHTHHVWSGTVEGLNGPYMDFVKITRTPNKIPGQFDKVFALDCEMSYTGRGLELTKVTVIGHNGAVVYDHFVRPEAEVVDYNTRFSGITEQDLNGFSHTAVKTLQEVQHDLMGIFDTNTILIGHGLENDLRVLRIVHEAVIDTSIVFPHSSGFPYKLSLKSLAKIFLNRDIQAEHGGHCSYEDSQTCLDLMIRKVRMDSKK